jgi:hypothetical protein
MYQLLTPPFHPMPGAWKIETAAAAYEDSFWYLMNFYRIAPF